MSTTKRGMKDEEGAANPGGDVQPTSSDATGRKRRSVSSGSVNINRVDKRISSNGTLPESQSQATDGKRRSKKLFPSLTNKAGTEVLNPAASSPAVHKQTKMHLSSVPTSSKMSARSPRHLVSERKRKGMSFFQSKTSTFKEEKDDKSSSDNVTKTRSSTPPPLMSSPPKGKGISLMVKDKEEKKSILQLYFDLYRNKEEELCQGPQSLRSPYHYLPLLRLQDILEHEELKKTRKIGLENQPKNGKKGDESDSDSDSDSEEEKKQKKKKKREKEKEKQKQGLQATKPATPPLPPLPAPLPAPLPGAIPPPLLPTANPLPPISALPPPLPNLPPPDEEKKDEANKGQREEKEDDGGVVRSQSSTQFKIPRSSSTSNSSPQFDEFTKPEEKKGEDKRFSSLDGRWEKIDTSQVSLFSPAITFSSSSTVKIACLPNKHDSSSELSTEMHSIEQFRTLLAEHAKKNRKTLQEIDFKVITFQQWFISMSEGKDAQIEKKQKEKELNLKQVRENEYSSKRKPVDRRGTASQEKRSGVTPVPVLYTQKASDPTEIERSYGGVRITVNPLRVFLRALEAHREREAAAEQVPSFAGEVDEKYLLEQKKERDQLEALEKQRNQLVGDQNIVRMEEPEQPTPNGPEK